MDYQAFFKLSYGLYILSSVRDGQYNGHVSNTAFQVTAEPPRIIVATHRDNLTTEFIRSSRVFALSVLDNDSDLDFLGPWGFQSGREVRKFDQTDFRIGKTGAPLLLDHALAAFECEVEKEVIVGTHVLFIGKVIDASVFQEEAEPLTYDWYRREIKGVSPKHSPGYISPDKLSNESGGQHPESVEDDSSAKKSVKNSGRYRCVICGFVYDPEVGDPDSGIAPGTAFEDIPDDWACPVCGVGKADFVLLE